MTFIVAIQLEDSIIVAADNRSVVVQESGDLQYRDDSTSKIYAWKSGIIVGSGESTVVSRAIEFFIKISKSKIETLPQCLNISRKIRELEAENFHIQTTKLLYSDNVENGVQLYTIQPSEQGEYQITKCEENGIVLWLFNPDVTAIIKDLEALYASLKPREYFCSTRDWLNYYIEQFSQIYKKQAQTDSMMSSSFDVFFQSSVDYIFGHIDNIQNEPLVFNQISYR